MISSIRHKGLKLLFDDDDRSRLRPDLVRRIAVILAALDEADTIADMDRPAFRLHPLKGDLAGFWSVWVNGNWRIVFRFAGGQVSDVDLIDYH